MDWLIQDARAESAPATAGPPGLESMFLLLAFFVVFYFLMIRPQLKRQKDHRKMISGLQKGDEIVTSGGALGRVTEVEEQYVGVEIARGVEIRIQRQAVAQILPKGTVKLG